MQRALANAKAKAEAALQTQSSAVKGTPPEEKHVQAPELSPDTYDPFQASLEDPAIPAFSEDPAAPDDTDLPGPPPLVCSAFCEGHPM